MKMTIVNILHKVKGHARHVMAVLLVLLLILPLLACKAEEADKQVRFVSKPPAAEAKPGTSNAATTPPTTQAPPTTPAPTFPPTTTVPATVEQTIPAVLQTIPEITAPLYVEEVTEAVYEEPVDMTDAPVVTEVPAAPVEVTEAPVVIPTEAPTPAPTEAPTPPPTEAPTEPTPYNHPGVLVLNSAHPMQEDFGAWLSAATVPVILDYGATWCGPCQQAAPVLQELASAYNGQLIVVSIDVDAASGGHSSIASLVNQVQSVPTFDIYVGGSKVKSKGGYNGNSEELKTFCLSVI